MYVQWSLRIMDTLRRSIVHCVSEVVRSSDDRQGGKLLVHFTEVVHSSEYSYWSKSKQLPLYIMAWLSRM